MNRILLGVFFVFVLGAATPSGEPVDLGVINRIKQEGFKNSQVMETAFYLTDVFGGRLTGSPALKNAANWARDKMEEWGLENAALEPWGVFGQGWSVTRCRVEMLTPEYANLISAPQSWSPGTVGELKGSPVILEIEEQEDFARYAGKLKGAIVMVGGESAVDAQFEADASRLTEEALEATARAPLPKPSQELLQQKKERSEKRKLERMIEAFVYIEGAAVAVYPGTLGHGTIRVHGSGTYRIGAPAGTPSIVVAAEQYNRIVRLVKKGIGVDLSIDLQTEFHPDDPIEHNVIAEIPGTDKKLKNEVVMLGAHLDSWHAGTGASDNAAGCVVMMEAVRILKAIGVKPRRTIRIALWSGEEQGLFGSRGYVLEHFGNPLTMELKPEHERFSCYFNLDNGTGRIRGIHIQENDAVRPIFEAWLEPFHDLKASTVSIRNATSTDHVAFDEVGLPGFQFIQDPIDYGRTWHTNMDVYDYLQENDLMWSSVIVASLVYHAAMRNEKLPRKPLPQPLVLPESD